MIYFNPSSNPKITELYLFLVQYSNSDTELWYGGHSDVNYIISIFTENDIEELVNDLKDWEPPYLTNLSHALTADDDRGDPAVRSYIYAHIFLSLSDYHIFNIMDDFSYLKNSNQMIVPIIERIKDKLNQFDFLNYDKVSLGMSREIIDELQQTL